LASRFRSKAERTFAVASTATPVLLGVVIGAIATGAVATAARQVTNASFGAVFVTPWLAPFPLVVGALALALFAQLAATYLTLATNDAGLQADFRRRALASASVAVILGAIAAALAYTRLPVLDASLLPATASATWVGITGSTAAVAIWALWRRSFRLARIAAAAQVSLILWGWAATQYPYLIPATVTIRGAAAPDTTLAELLMALAVGTALLIPSLVYLVRTFTGRANK
jgi:cytochrome d ubiquinol oxidase subunit II